ncbi:hypothetical protein SAMN05660976_03005 [Nonomuraea pusilla]|uniref:Uncharacterized protein n=1 Tax=Nonomuraea pusilla TaxID=46177 RepID=A0A1H7S1T3_9ACTN|nr:hypothetical protein SAMN05660976_03005 [Nonomuraea pusilla]
MNPWCDDGFGAALVAKATAEERELFERGLGCRWRGFRGRLWDVGGNGFESGSGMSAAMDSGCFYGTPVAVRVWGGLGTPAAATVLGGARVIPVAAVGRFLGCRRR